MNSKRMGFGVTVRIDTMLTDLERKANTSARGWRQLEHTFRRQWCLGWERREGPPESNRGRTVWLVHTEPAHTKIQRTESMWHAWGTASTCVCHGTKRTKEGPGWGWGSNGEWHWEWITILLRNIIPMADSWSQQICSHVGINKADVSITKRKRNGKEKKEMEKELMFTGHLPGARYFQAELYSVEKETEEPEDEAIWPRSHRK